MDVGSKKWRKFDTKCLNVSSAVVLVRTNWLFWKRFSEEVLLLPR